MSTNNTTPIERYVVQDKEVFVKREDSCVLPPAPPFSKVRGLWVHLEKQKSCGVDVVGYVETSISMAGWGVAWVCAMLNLKCVLFDPQYKDTPAILKYHRKQWKKFSPDIIPLPAGRARVNYYIGKKILKTKYGENAIMLDLGLPLNETIEETAKQWRYTMHHQMSSKTTIINIGSGTICAGIIRGWKPGDGTIIGVMGRSGNTQRMIDKIHKKAQRSINGLLGVPFKIVDPGWAYTEKSNIQTPFPCHPYYDKKAWQWMLENMNLCKPPILFWNIGRML
jgi:hypothetical protein